MEIPVKILLNLFMTLITTSRSVMTFRYGLFLHLEHYVYKHGTSRFHDWK